MITFSRHDDEYIYMYIYIYVWYICLCVYQHCIISSLIRAVKISCYMYTLSVWPLIRLGTHGTHRPAYVMMMVADVLAPNRRQAISDHYTDCSVIKESHDDTRIVLRNINIALQPLNEHCWRGVDRSAIRRFLYYWRIHPLTQVTPYVASAGHHRTSAATIWNIQD